MLRSSAPLLAQPGLMRSRAKPTWANAAMPRSSAASQSGSKSGWVIERASVARPSGRPPRTGASGMRTHDCPAPRMPRHLGDRPVEVAEVDLGDRHEPVGVAVHQVGRPLVPAAPDARRRGRGAAPGPPARTGRRERRVEELDVDAPLVAERAAGRRDRRTGRRPTAAGARAGACRSARDGRRSLAARGRSDPSAAAPPAAGE